MGLLSAIKSALGLGGSADSSARTDVTVERETDVSNERAVKESGPDAREPEVGSEAAKTGATSAGAGSGEADTPEGESVEEIKGIGPTYADRLAEAGVHAVEDLAAADAATLDDATDIDRGRLETWIERAKGR